MFPISLSIDFNSTQSADLCDAFRKVHKLGQSQTELQPTAESSDRCTFVRRRLHTFICQDKSRCFHQRLSCVNLTLFQPGRRGPLNLGVMMCSRVQYATSLISVNVSYSVTLIGWPIPHTFIGSCIKKVPSFLALRPRTYPPSW